MSVNRHQKHLLVLPEDKANRQIANGFLLELSINSRAVQVLQFAGGWGNVIQEFLHDYVPTMRKYPQTMIALLIDFDDHKPNFSSYEDRLNYIKSQIPDDLEEKVFILGSRTSPEKLKTAMNNKSFEAIGESLAKDCAENTNETWGHDYLKHNEKELKRMILSVKPFLFTDY
jgi:mitochondrial fission protein ELM1